MDVDARRRMLLELGKKVFTETAYDQLSTDELAARAGISKGLLYHYFPSKRDFYVATIREVARQVLEDTRPQPAGTFEEKLDRSLTAFVCFVESNCALYSTLVRGGIGSDQEVNQVLEELRQTSADRLIQQLEVTSPTPELLTAVYGWIGFVEFACLYWNERRAFPREQLIGLLKDAIRAVVDRR